MMFPDMFINTIISYMLMEMVVMMFREHHHHHLHHMFTCQGTQFIFHLDGDGGDDVP